MRTEHRFSVLLYVVVFALIFPVASRAQFVSGVVLGGSESEQKLLRGAHVYWFGTSSGVVTDSTGRFRLSDVGIRDRRLIASHVAFFPDTLEVGSRSDITIHLTIPTGTEEVEIVARSPDTFVKSAPQYTEVITSGELEKAACCDLAGCFGTTSAVQAETADIVTDTKQLSMLGLRGVYTQTLVDNVPALLGGLNTHLGIDYIPGPLIDRIAVVKGAGSVLNGAESFSGIINVLLREPEGDEPFFFNAIANSMLEQQYNAYTTQKLGEARILLGAHGVRQGLSTDRNKDTFLDAPLLDRFSVLGKVSLGDIEDRVLSNTGIKFTWEDRLGGQKSYDPDLHARSGGLYGQHLVNKRIELFDRTEFAIGETDALRMHFAGAYHVQDAVYGSTLYEAEENTIHVDASFAASYEEEHSIVAGAAYRYNLLRESVDLGFNPHGKTYDGSSRIEESVPGVFAENTSNFLEDKLSLMAGVRVDFWKEHGAILTPRVFARYAVDEVTTLRASVGTAFRTAKVFAENPVTLASWRDIEIAGSLEPERALNYGVNIQRYYDIGQVSGSVQMDFYRTEFASQVIPDYDSNPSVIRFKNVEDASVSQMLHAEITAAFSFLTGRFSYSLSDVFEKTVNGNKPIPFHVPHRVMAVLSAETEASDWQATVSAEWMSAQELPSLDAYPAQYRILEASSPYTLVNVNIVRKWEWFDLYGGVENLLDFRQSHPIINAAKPFERYFDPSFAWGPVLGVELYLGIRARVAGFGL